MHDILNNFDHYDLSHLDSVPTPSDSGLDQDILLAFDRMSNDVEAPTFVEINDLIDKFHGDPESLMGLVNNAKGILGEMKLIEHLNSNPHDHLLYVLPHDTNNKDIDIYGLNDTNEIVRKIQVKMTDDPSYIRETIDNLPPDVELFVNSEMAEYFHNPDIIDSGISNSDITSEIEQLVSILNEVDPIIGDDFDSEHVNLLNES